MIAGQSVRVLTVALVLLTVVTAVGLLFLSPPFAALVGLVLIATAVATVMSRLASRWSVLIAAGSSAIFTLAHVAESARLVNPAAGLLRISSLFDSGLLSRPEVWLPVLLAIPAFSLIVACAQSLSLGLQRHREVLIEAERSLREMAHEDPATGLESRSRGEDRLAGSIAVALRYRRPLSIILVGFDPPPGLDEEREHPEELLRDLGAYLVASKRDSDSLSVFDTHTVMMVASEVGIEGARVFLARVCAEATRRLGRTVRGAIVSIPDDGDSVDDLLQEAAASLAFCRSAGVTISDRFFLSGETAAISGSDAPA